MALPSREGKGHALFILPRTGSRGGRNGSEQNQEHQAHVQWRLWGSEVSAPHREATAPGHHHCCHMLLGQKGPFPSPKGCFPSQPAEHIHTQALRIDRPSRGPLQQPGHCCPPITVPGGPQDTCGFFLNVASTNVSPSIC